MYVFQFLLVRLREFRILGAPVIDDVISIPSGAIKSAFSAVSPAAITAFQFLLVRLRVDAAKMRAWSIIISIPSGAIKSRVRTCQLYPSQYFNSFWCD